MNITRVVFCPIVLLIGLSACLLYPAERFVRLKPRTAEFPQQEEWVCELVHLAQTSSRREWNRMRKLQRSDPRWGAMMAPQLVCYAAQQRYSRAVRRLLREVPSNAVIDQEVGNFALELAQAGNNRVLEGLIRSQAADERAILIAAIEANYSQVVVWLATRSEWFHYEVVRNSVRLGSETIVQALIASIIDVDTMLKFLLRAPRRWEDEMGHFPDSYLNLVRLVARNGANIHQTAERGVIAQCVEELWETHHRLCSSRRFLLNDLVRPLRYYNKKKRLQGIYNVAHDYLCSLIGIFANRGATPLFDIQRYGLVSDTVMARARELAALRQVTIRQWLAQSGLSTDLENLVIECEGSPLGPIGRA